MWNLALLRCRASKTTTWMGTGGMTLDTTFSLDKMVGFMKDEASPFKVQKWNRLYKIYILGRHCLNWNPEFLGFSFMGNFMESIPNEKGLGLQFLKVFLNLFQFKLWAQGNNWWRKWFPADIWTPNAGDFTDIGIIGTRFVRATCCTWNSIPGRIGTINAFNCLVSISHWRENVSERTRRRW